MDRVFKLPSTTFIGGGKDKSLSLREILKRLENAYCKYVVFVKISFSTFSLLSVSLPELNEFKLQATECTQIHEKTAHH